MKHLTKYYFSFRYDNIQSNQKNALNYFSIACQFFDDSSPPNDVKEYHGICRDDEIHDSSFDLGCS